MDKKQEFIEKIAPHAKEVQAKYGVPASIVIAQAALESGWGASAPGNNLFGIKAGKSWNGACNALATREVINGKSVQITDGFRAYGSTEDSVQNYGKFLQENRRYAAVLQAGNANDAADELQRAGYATDPQYAAKLKQIIAANDLTRFDDASYSGYAKDGNEEEFERTRKRLREQRVADPGTWDDFMKSFLQLIFASIFSTIQASLKGNGNQPPSPAESHELVPPLPTPAVREASAGAPVPPRG